MRAFMFIVMAFFGLGVGVLAAAVSRASIPLPRPSHDGKVSVERAIQERRTIRDFRETPLSIAQLSQLVWACQGITDPVGVKRAAPSGGALYPMDVYAVAGTSSVEGVPEGVYHYEPEKHSLSLVREGDLRKDVAAASLGQMWIARAPVVLVITAEYQRITGKYGQRGIRYALIEAGHIGQNLFLQAEALGLGAGIVGAFEDREVSKAMRLPSRHEPLLVMPVGYREPDQFSK